MQLTVKRNDLLQELTLVMGVVEKKQTIPILANVLLEVSATHLGITATDQDLGLRCGCAVESDGVGAITVPSRKLFDIVRLLPEAALQVVVHENNWVEIRCENSNFKVAGMPKENYPDVPEFRGQRILIPTAILKELILRTHYAITQEESRYALNGAKFIMGPGWVRMVTTDGHRLAYVQKNVDLEGVEKEDSTLISRKTLSELLKLFEQQLTVEMGWEERLIYFGVGSRELVSRVLSGQFPSYEMVLPKDNKQVLLCNTALLGDCVKRASIMAEERNKPVKFIVKGSRLELMAATAEQGESRERMEVEYEGENLQIAFNAQYLLDFLATLKTEKVSLAFKDQESQVLLRPHGEEDFDYQYVVMPMSA